MIADPSGECGMEEGTIQPGDLPESLREVLELVGLAGVMLLVERFGGVRIFIPKQVGREHVLVWTLGWEMARLLCRHFGGETINVPRASRAMQSLRNRHLVARHRQGATVRELAQSSGLTERRVYAILAQFSRSDGPPPGAPAPRPPAPFPPDAGRFREHPVPVPGG